VVLASPGHVYTIDIIGMFKALYPDDEYYSDSKEEDQSPILGDNVSKVGFIYTIVE
jgi:hypothetical protein